MLAQVEPLGESSQTGGRHERRLELRHVTFVVLRKLVKQQVGHDQPKHRVAEKFHRLVVDDASARVLVRTRSMCQGMFEQSSVAKPMTDPTLEFREFLIERYVATAGDRRPMGLDDA